MTQKGMYPDESFLQNTQIQLKSGPIRIPNSQNVLYQSLFILYWGDEIMFSNLEGTQCDLGG